MSPELYLQENSLTTLPDEIRDMEELKIIDLSSNKFEDFPAIICDCPKLKTVIIKDNKIKGNRKLISSFFHRYVFMHMSVLQNRQFLFVLKVNMFYLNL